MINRFFNKSVKVISTILFGVIFIGLIFADYIDYYGKKSLPISNLILFLIIVAIVLLMYFFFKKHKFNFNVKKTVLIINLVLLIYQIYMARNIYFITGWDAGGLLDMSINRGFYINYMSTYPNNLLLLYIEIFIARVNETLHIFNGPMSCKYVIFLLINIAINNLTCFLTYKCASLYLKDKYTLAVYLLGILLFGISPWIVIFYSDSVGILFPILLFYLYSLSKNKKSKLYTVLLILAGIFSYFIKPQCFIMMIAIGIYEIFNSFKDKKRLIKVFVCIAVCLASLTPIQKGLIYVAKYANADLKSESAFGASHFLMMGLNTNTGGSYSNDDVGFSSSFSTKKERTEANLKECVNRLNNMGFSGFISHACKKALNEFNDATFAWGGEGNFYCQTFEKDNAGAIFLRNVYYNDGQYYILFSLFERFIWLMIFGFVFVSTLFKSDDNKSILLFSLVGLTIFELLFEARARYLFTYLPIFCLVAGFGIRDLKAFLERHLNAHLPNKLFINDSKID